MRRKQASPSPVSLLGNMPPFHPFHCWARKKPSSPPGILGLGQKEALFPSQDLRVRAERGPFPLSGP